MPSCASSSSIHVAVTSLAPTITPLTKSESPIRLRQGGVTASRAIPDRTRLSGQMKGGLTAKPSRVLPRSPDTSCSGSVILLALSKLLPQPGNTYTDKRRVGICVQQSCGALRAVFRGCRLILEVPCHPRPLAVNGRFARRDQRGVVQVQVGTWAFPIVRFVLDGKPQGVSLVRIKRRVFTYVEWLTGHPSGFNFGMQRR